VAPYVLEQALERSANASSSVRVEGAVGLSFQAVAVCLQGGAPSVDEGLERAGNVAVVVGRAERDGVEAPLLAGI
jgi:hypothetical protein